MKSNLERQAARLFTVGFHGHGVSEELQGLIDRGVGGVVWFSRNVGTPAEVLELNREIKRIANREILIAVDQEGGQVRRLRSGFSDIPAMRVVGEARDPALARELGGVIGKELRAVGFDMCYAPVLDVDTNPDNPVIGARAFGSTPELVSEMGVALAMGLEEAGIAACGKHFPGHGDTRQDSHLELPKLAHDVSRLETVELAPFRAAAKAGIAALMTAHVVFEAVDPKYPATLSGAVLSGILRKQLGYDGLVVSDDIEMGAIADNYGVEDAVVLGLNAGVDQFLCCHTAALAHRAIDAVVRAFENGSLGPQALEAANSRLANVCRRFARPVGDPTGLSVLRSGDHLGLVQRLLATELRASELATDPTEVMQRVALETPQR